MVSFLNKKNKARIYDILNKYFKSEFEYDFTYIRNIIEDNKTNQVINSEMVSLKIPNVSINDDIISILLDCLEMNITINLDYGTKIETKGTYIKISIPYENQSGYETIVKIQRARTLEQKEKDDLDIRNMISNILNPLKAVSSFYPY